MSYLNCWEPGNVEIGESPALLEEVTDEFGEHPGLSVSICGVMSYCRVLAMNLYIWVGTLEIQSQLTLCLKARSFDCSEL
jgi:hypothetical protein